MNSHLPKLKLLDSTHAWEERRRVLSAFLREKFRNRTGLIEVLEAGCGRAWPLDLGTTRLKITGVDLDGLALDARVKEMDDLDRVVVGDLRVVDFAPEEFDLIYCCEVLEHISGARDVLKRFLGWLKRDGVMILVFPDRATVFGWATRASPHWLHIVYHRYILGLKEAGKPGFPPYRTHYDEIISRCGIHKFCAKHGCRIALEYGRPVNATDWPAWLLGPYEAIAPIISAVSGGRIACTHIGLVYAIEKK